MKTYFSQQQLDEAFARGYALAAAEGCRAKTGEIPEETRSGRSNRWKASGHEANGTGFVEEPCKPPTTSKYQSGYKSNKIDADRRRAAGAGGGSSWDHLRPETADRDQQDPPGEDGSPERAPGPYPGGITRNGNCFYVCMSKEIGPSGIYTLEAIEAAIDGYNMKIGWAGKGKTGLWEMVSRGGVLGFTSFDGAVRSWRGKFPRTHKVALRF
jgi:hypothetical protein